MTLNIRRKSFGMAHWLMHACCVALSALLLLSCGNGIEGMDASTLSSPMSNSASTLDISTGESKGYCVYVEDKLLTTGGSMSEKQLGEALRFMSYWEQLLTAGTPAFIASYAKVLGIGTEAGKKAASESSDDVAGLLLKISDNVKIPVIKWWVVAGAGASVVNLIYRVNRGVNEGELTSDTLVQSVVGFFPFNFLVEHLQREHRVDALISGRGGNSFSEKKMGIIIDRIQNTTPKYPGECKEK